MAITATQLKNETERTCRTAAQFQSRMSELKERALGISAAAKRNGRTLTHEEKEHAVDLMVESDRIGDMPMPMTHSLDSVDGDEPRTTSARWLTKDGREIRALSPRERLAEVPLADGRTFHPLSLGKAIIGLATGRWDNARAERLAMAEGGNAVGGYLVPPAFSTTVIDLARARSAVVQAGAITIPWPAPSDELILARVCADPTFSLVAENAEIPPSDVNFDQVTFQARKVACLVKMSRELAEDATNAASLIEQTLGRALAAELDRMALVGVSGQELNGLLHMPDVEETGSIGGIAWEDVHNAAVAVRTRNHEPTAYISSPTIAGDLDLIQASTAGTWLGAPPSLAGVQRFTTTNCPDANLFIGDWSQFVFGLRTDASIEVTTQAGEAFQQHQVWVKITWRGDVNALHQGAFHRLVGITT